MASISTHVLDTALGLPASGVVIHLSKLSSDQFMVVAEKTTDEKGRSNLVEESSVGQYRLEFMVKDYFLRQKQQAFFPKITIDFILEHDQHYHVPLLLSPFGFSTYRGS